MQSIPDAPQHGRRSARRAIVAPVRVAAARSASARSGRSPVQQRFGVGMTALALIAGFSIAPTGTAQAAPAAQSATSTAAPAQTLAVDADVIPAALTRDSVTATAAVQNLRASATNEDWARLVLISGGWPQSEQNVTVMLRWMRQENGPDNWWNRNNPLNNGYGSGGGSGLGSYPNLVSAAEYAAANLQRGYPDVVAGLVAGDSADATAAAIWASPWATSHYGNGSHWSTAPVPIIAAPPSAWQ